MTRVPKRPNSSPMMAKIKSLCASGIQFHFCRLWPSPTPNHPPEARAYTPLRYWSQAPSWLQSPNQLANLLVRLSLKMEKRPATTPAATSARASSHLRTPANINPARIIMPTMTAVPRSLPPRIKASTAAPPTPTGRTTCQVLRTRLPLAASTAPIQRARASLAASEGWNVTGPSFNQFKLPLTSTPKGVKINTSRATAKRKRTGAILFHSHAGTHDSTNISANPPTAKPDSFTNKL